MKEKSMEIPTKKVHIGYELSKENTEQKIKLLEQIAIYFPFALPIYYDNAYICHLTMLSDIDSALTSVVDGHGKLILKPMPNAPKDCFFDFNGETKSIMKEIAESGWSDMELIEDILFLGGSYCDIPYCVILIFAKYHYDFNCLIDKKMAINFKEIPAQTRVKKFHYEN